MQHGAVSGPGQLHRAERKCVLCCQLCQASSFLPLGTTLEHPLLFCSTFLAVALQKNYLLCGQEQWGQQELVLPHSHWMWHFRVDRGDMWVFDLVKKTWAGWVSLSMDGVEGMGESMYINTQTGHQGWWWHLSNRHWFHCDHAFREHFQNGLVHVQFPSR